MKEFDERATPNRSSFVAHSQPLSADDVGRALRRMAHEVIERTSPDHELLVIGLQTGGVPFASRLANLIDDIGERSVQQGQLDVAFYRDDLDRRPLHASAPTSMPTDVQDRVVLLVDDVLFTGRTIRAALNALAEWGRPRAIQLAVMVDRGHRELPIRPDYVGKNLPTSPSESIVATLDGVWLGTRS